MMDVVLRELISALAKEYLAVEGCGLSTLARRCRNDSSFFERLSDPSKSFTVRTFDEVVTWMRSNWPNGHEFPAHLLRLPTSVQSQPTLPSDPAVVAAEALHGGDLGPVEIPDRALPADAVRAGDAASTAPACEPADSN